MCLELELLLYVVAVCSKHPLLPHLFIRSFVHSFNKHWLGLHHVPDFGERKRLGHSPRPQNTQVVVGLHSPISSPFVFCLLLPHPTSVYLSLLFIFLIYFKNWGYNIDHKIHFLKVSNSVVFSRFTKCVAVVNIEFQRIFITSGINPVPISSHSHVPFPSVPGNYCFWSLWICLF